MSELDESINLEPTSKFEYHSASVFSAFGIENDAPKQAKQMVSTIPCAFSRINRGEDTTTVLQDLREKYTLSHSPQEYYVNTSDINDASTREQKKVENIDGARLTHSAADLVMYLAVKAKSSAIAKVLGNAAVWIDGSAKWSQ